MLSSFENYSESSEQIMIWIENEFHPSVIRSQVYQTMLLHNYIPKKENELGFRLT